MGSLQTTCLVRVDHRHGLQDVLTSLTLHCPTPNGDRSGGPQQIVVAFPPVPGTKQYLLQSRVCGGHDLGLSRTNLGPREGQPQLLSWVLKLLRICNKSGRTLVAMDIGGWIGREGLVAGGLAWLGRRQ